MIAGERRQSILLIFFGHWIFEIHGMESDSLDSRLFGVDEPSNLNHDTKLT